MSTFFSGSFKPQPHIRQEGFHLDNESGSASGLQATGEHHEASGAGGNTPPPFDFGRGNVMDFTTDDLASLMGAASPHPGHGQSHHGHDGGLSQSHHDNHLHGGHPGSHHESQLHGLHHGHHQHNQSHERSTHSPSEDVSGSYRTHNIFDMGVGAPVGVSPTTTTTGTSHFNSTVPPLNSSMRYEPPSHSQHDYQHSANTPSPPLGVGNGREQSRSRSRPPTSSGASTGGVGPTRTTRTRRTNSISSTSSPPPHIRPAAQAIVIPGVRHTNGSMASPLSSSATSVTNPWGFTSSSPTSASDFTLPTPDSLHHHHHSNSLSHSLHTPHLSSSVGFGGYFGSADFGGYGGHGSQHNGGHTPSTSLPTIGGSIHSHLGGSGGGSGHHRTSSASASTTAGSAAAAAAGAGGAPGSASLSPAEKQVMAANEKRRRRRESHNAVERRRRDNINEKISELATLIPESLLEGGTLPAAGASGPQAILPSGSNGGSAGGDSPSATTDLLSPISPAVDNDIWNSGLISMKKEDGPDSTLGGLDSPILPPGGIGGPNTTAPTNGNGAGNGSANANANANGVVKANKGMILRKSVEYIRYLQQLVQEQDSRNRQLEMELRGYRERNGESLSPILPPPAFDFQSNGASLGNGNGNSGAYHGAGYAGSFRMLHSMPEDETEHRPGVGNNGGKKSRDSTPLSDDDHGDDDDPNDPDVQPPASLKKGSVPATKRTTRGRKAAEAGTRARRSKKNAGDDVDMGGSDDEGEAMEV
ncbi:hypothetical protein AAF712_014718 [Marasmius tenuissimus]|uniref:BHLH domain-containing protein n=1 Tax=Marasmius tenuissimus TaxID=585030 RepID=A0ABR2ZBJ5_9AGAR